MNESIYHVYANYCGERRLLFAGYASRVARKLNLSKALLSPGEFTGYIPSPTTDRFGNRMPYQLWEGPVELVWCPINESFAEYEGEAS